VTWKQVEYIEYAAVLLLPCGMGIGSFVELRYHVPICPIKLARMKVILYDQRSCVVKVIFRTSFDAALEPVDFNAFIPGPDIYALVETWNDITVKPPRR
jgi:hypothetical protein